MLIYAFLCLASINVSTASSGLQNIHRHKRSDDYVPCEIGWYYFRNSCYRAEGRKIGDRLSWERALARCGRWGADLASITSQEEQEFIVAFLQMDIQYWAWIGLNDRERESVNRWTDGSIYNYSIWRPGEPSGFNDESEDCVHMLFEVENDYIGTWNDRACHVREGYICEKTANPRMRSPNPMYCSFQEGGGWKYHTSCYHVVAEMKSWEDAEKHCKDRYHGNLVTIRDKLEDIFLDYIIKNTPGLEESLWIGIKTKEQLQQKWTSGWYVSYNGFRREDFIKGTCVARRANKDWIKIPCSRQLSFICEVSKARPPVLTQPAKGAHCPNESNEWRDLGGEHCYYIETSKKLNFYEASFDCNSRGGHLVSLHSREEAEILRPFVQYIHYSIYIGLIRRRFPTGDKFMWLDGSPLDYENWNIDEPNSDEEKCVDAVTREFLVEKKMKWRDIMCETKEAYICSVKKVLPQKYEEDTDCGTFSDDDNIRKDSDDFVPCEKGWYYFREKCYKAVGRSLSERLPWERALARCRSWGADLASIQSQEEQDFIIAFLQLDIQYWAWIGLNDRHKESVYKWTDESAFNYSNWKAGEPSGYKEDIEDCVHMVFEPGHNVGKWNDRACDVREGYICEMNADPKKKSPNPMRCLSEEGGGWKYQTSCYHIVPEMKSWENAEKHCQDKYNGHLLTIRDTLEDTFLDFILTDTQTELWIGIKTQEQLQQKWTSGWFVSYNDFGKDCNFVEGTCVARKSRTEWITIPCSTELSFVCEVSKATPPVLKPPPSGAHCPKDFDDWRDLGGEYCYHIENKRTLNFFEASFECKRRGGELVSLHSGEEAEILRPFVQFLHWSIYIGLIRRFPHDDFAWTDGSALDYENWNPNEPNNLDEKCVEATANDIIGARKMVWNDLDCGNKRSFICSVKKVIPITSVIEGIKGIAEEGNEDCARYCVSPSTYLFAIIKNCADAKRLR